MGATQDSGAHGRGAAALSFYYSFVDFVGKRGHETKQPYGSYSKFFNGFAYAPYFDYLFIVYFIKMPVISD